MVGRYKSVEEVEDGSDDDNDHHCQTPSLSSSSSSCEEVEDKSNDYNDHHPQKPSLLSSSPPFSSS